MAPSKRTPARNRRRVPRNRSLGHLPEVHSDIVEITLLYLQAAVVMVFAVGLVALTGWGIYLCFEHPDKANALAILLSGPLTTLLAGQVRKFLPINKATGWPDDNKSIRTTKKQP